ncbi:vacuolar ATP synthase subunit f [Gracilaria domingensis]|nr:vacuolar ATP synthase subunit f [Gracilaria domingensis]
MHSHARGAAGARVPDTVRHTPRQPHFLKFDAALQKASRALLLAGRAISLKLRPRRTRAASPLQLASHAIHAFANASCRACATVRPRPRARCSPPSFPTVFYCNHSVAHAFLSPVPDIYLARLCSHRKTYKSREGGFLIAVIGDEDTTTGFLLAGVGDNQPSTGSNFFVVDPSTLQ